MSQAWYKVDNVAKVFLATTTRRDPRVFRISCTLTEEVEPDTLNEALRRTAGEWPQFQVTLHRGLFWNYLESTDGTTFLYQEKEVYACRETLAALEPQLARSGFAPLRELLKGDSV